MGWIFIVILIAVIIYVAVRLRALESEIRAEQTANASATSATPATSHDSQKDSTESLQIRLLRLVMQQPGIRQTEVYLQLAQNERREIQSLLRELDQQKLLRREKQGNTFALYPA